MASDKEKNKEQDKKKSWFDLDSFIAGYGLRWLKSQLKKRLGAWKAEAAKHAQEVQGKTREKLELKDILYFQLAHLFQKGEPADREVVEAGVRVSVEVVDGLIDQLPFVPKAAKSVAGDLGGDAVTEVRDHFAHTDVKIPDDLPKIQGADMAKEASERLKNLLKEIFTSAFDFLKNISDQLSSIHVGFSLKPKLNRFLATLFAIPDLELTDNFSDFFKSELMKLEEPEKGFYTLVPDDDAQDDFADMAENWDTDPEFVSWISKPLKVQRQEFAQARMLKKHAGPARLHRDLQRAVDETLPSVAGAVSKLNKTLKSRKDRRKVAKFKRNKIIIVMVGIAAYIWIAVVISHKMFPTNQVGQGLIIALAIVAPAMIFALALRRSTNNG